MFNRGGLDGNIFEELLETGNSVKKQASQVSPGQILKTAGKQIAGGAGQRKPGKEDKTFAEMMSLGNKDEKGEAFDPTKVTSEQLKQMKATDVKKSSENYKKIQQQLLQLYLKEKQKELPVYQAGKPGAARTYAEEQKLIEKKTREEEKQKKEQQGPLLPRSPRRMPGLGLFVKQKQGTGETRLGKAG